MNDQMMNQEDSNKNIDKNKMRECHEKAAEHFQKAAECHREAMKHCESDEKDKAMASALKAMGHTVCGLKEAKKLAKHCACIEEKA